jgi:hypothetical protein
MNAQELQADQTGDGSIIFVDVTGPDERGALSHEPCRYCHRQGGVYFVVDDSPFGRNSPQVTACSLCGMSWEADSPLAR